MTRRRPTRPVVVTLIGVALCCCAAPTHAADPVLASPTGPVVAPDPTDIPIPPPPQESLPLGAAPDRPVAAPNRAAAPADTGSIHWILQTGCALAIVIALIYAMRLVLQRLSGNAPIGSATRAVEVLSRTAIAPKTSVLLLKVNQTILVVGHSPQGLSTLATFDDPADVAQLLTAVSASKPLSITESFRSVLSGADRPYDAMEGDAGGDRDDAEQYVDRARDEVGGLKARLAALKGRRA